MKHLIYIFVVILASVFVSCSGNTSNNSSTTNSSSSTAMSQDTASNQNTDTTGNTNQADVDLSKIESSKAPTNQEITNNNDNAKPELEKPNVPVKPETPTDKLLKQYNEALGALIEASKNGGTPSEEATHKFMNLQTQLEELESSGKLSTTQKELFKVTKDAFNMLKSKK